MEGNVEKDPLEELREADRWMSKKFYDRIADAWQTERERHQSLVDSMASSLNECAAKTYVMQGRLDSLPEVADLRDKLDTLQSCYDADLEEHKEEVAELKEELDDCEEERSAIKEAFDGVCAKLDASIPLPLDADGVLWTGNEKEFINVSGHICEFKGFRTFVDGHGWCLVDEKECQQTASLCRHVATRPETIEDVRKDGDDADWYKFGSGTSRSTAQSLIDRAYECGKRDGGDGEWTGRPLF